MREILFRGYQMFKENDGWVYGYLKIGDIAGTRTAFIIPADFDKCPIKEAPVYEHTVSQYTGLKDNNGVKVFEGDIIKSTETEEVAVVQWFEEHSSFMVYIPSHHAVDYIGEVESGIIEVVGNIYENPSLLGEESE